MKLSKSLGQVFLKNNNYIKKIIDFLDMGQNEVLEIGPGSGVMTEHLLSKAKFLYCVELDLRFYNLLKNKFKDNKNIEIIHSDILELPLSNLKNNQIPLRERNLGEGLVVFGNVPYQISNDLISYFVENRRYIRKAYLTFQKEFVDKLTAEVSSKAYGFLSCYIQYYAKVEKLFCIPASAFSPVPKVDSAFMRLEFYKEPVVKALDEGFLFKIIRNAFNQRRKKIINSLAFLEGIEGTLSSLGINSHARAENLSLKDYVAIANIYKHG